MSNQESPLQEEVNIEEIMQAIHKQILAKKGMTYPDGTSIVQIEGKRLSPEFYEHLYQAGLIYDQIHVPIFLSKISVPLIGPFLQRLRQKVHELVIYYVNQLAADQIRVNHHLLRALSILGEELEQAKAS